MEPDYGFQTFSPLPSLIEISVKMVKSGTNELINCKKYFCGKMFFPLYFVSGMV
jgi:hypothetical protein